MTTFRLLVVLLLAHQHFCTAFVTPSRRPNCLNSVRLASSSSGEGPYNNNNAPNESRIAGNQRPPTEQEIAVMDQMIDKLSNAKPYELPNAVQRAFRVISSPQFFLRIAARQDQATGADKERLQALASNLVSTLEAVVSTTEDRLDERAQQLEKIVKAAAEPDSGEFLVPLAAERIEAMRSALNKVDPVDLDEGFLTTLDAWMSKSHTDGMDGMVVIFQKTLQLYAGIVIGRVRKEQNKEVSDVTRVVDTLLETDADQWDSVLTQHKEKIPQIVSEIQRTMETVVLGLEAGSMAQQIQAEYLKEMVKRAEAIV